MATAPTPGRVSDAGPDELSVMITLDGTKHAVYPNLLTAKDIAAVRAQAGMSVRKLVELAGDDPDIDVIAALVWVARCQAGEKVSLSDVSDGITYESKLEVAEQEAPLDDDHPLPEGGLSGPPSLPSPASFT
jgi:hypothetical protein